MSRVYCYFIVDSNIALCYAYKNKKGEVKMNSTSLDELEALEAKYKKDMEDLRKKRKELEIVKKEGMRAVTFTVQSSIYEACQARAELDGVTISSIVRAAFLSYSLGELKVDRNHLVYTEEKLATLDTLHVPRKTPGRPKQEAPVQATPIKEEKKEESNFSDYCHDKDGKSLRPSQWDHKNMAIEQFPIPHTLHPAIDPNPPLLFSTYGAKIDMTFERLCDKEYVEERMKHTKRNWDAFECKTYIGRCAMKFFLMNGIENLRYDYDVLSEDIERYKDTMEGFVQGQFEYDGKEYV